MEKYKFRYGPVSGTGKNRYHGGSFFRGIKTTNERKWAHAWEDQGIKPRGKRTSVNIPDNYDDIHRGNHNCKSWKDATKKRKQWM